MIASPEVKALVDALVLDSAMAIDRDELDAWMDCFEEAATYVVMPRENRALGLPVGIIHCASKDQIRDRVVCLRHANKFNPHYDRHILGGTRIVSVEDDTVEAETNFMVVQTTKTGESRLFCAGCYEDRIVFVDGRARLAARVVLVDTFSVPTLLATPL
jgi:anthranilate 1,2-dioxygenase small subunit